MDGFTNNEGANEEVSIKGKARLFAVHSGKRTANLEAARINSTEDRIGGEQISNMDIARQYDGLLKETLSGISLEDHEEFLAELSNEDRELAEKYLAELG